MTADFGWSSTTNLSRARIIKPSSVGFLLLLATFAIRSPAVAGELVMSRSAVQAVVKTALFTNHGRWDLIEGQCYAYLENPRISLLSGRMVMDARLSSRLGLDTGESCLGSTLVSEVRLSGKLVGTGSQLALQDIRIDNVKDDSTRQALDLLQAAAGTALPRSVNLDVLQLIKPALSPDTGIKLTLSAINVATVTTLVDNVTVHFDLKLKAE